MVIDELLKSTSALLGETLCGQAGGFHRLKCVARECGNCGPADLKRRLQCEVMETGKGSSDVAYWQWTSFKDAKGKTKVDKLKFTCTGLELVEKLVKEVTISCCTRINNLIKRLCLVGQLILFWCCIEVWPFHASLTFAHNHISNSTRVNSLLILIDECTINYNCIYGRGTISLEKELTTNFLPHVSQVQWTPKVGTHSNNNLYGKLKQRNEANYYVFCFFLKSATCKATILCMTFVMQFESSLWFTKYVFHFM